MKNLNPIHKIIFLLNNIFALLFLASFAIPHVPPQRFPLLSVLSLGVPLLIFIHIGFVLFWILVGFKKQFLLSSFCLLAAVGFSYFPYKFKEHTVISGNSFSVMSYNVRLFNKYRWIDDEEVPEKILDFITESNPDILTLQEYGPFDKVSALYPYKFKKVKGKKMRTFSGLNIFSKYPIVNRGSLDFENSTNNAIYVDIVRNYDTVRVYNLHLESFGIKPDSVNIAEMSEKDSKKLISRLKNSFSKQQDQVVKFNEHKTQCRYKVILCGDFNNTFYSWAYNNLKGDDLRDSYVSAGKGFGKTYSFNGYPLRIDFILAEEAFKINEHKSYEVRLSDHEPIMARLSY